MKTIKYLFVTVPTFLILLPGLTVGFIASLIYHG